MKTKALLTALTLLTALGCADSTTPDQSETNDPPANPAPALTDNPANPPTPGTSPGTQVPAAPTAPALAFELPALDGTPTHLADYQGQVVLIVNTASQCGLTPQYEQLQSLHEQYADAGLAILGFPANNFGSQEPGSDEEIAAFCEENFGVGFDMFAKLSVKGEDQHPLYTYLTSEDTNPAHAGDITWNFEKFLVNRKGEVIARFGPRTKPNAPEVVKAIETALKQK